MMRRNGLLSHPFSDGEADVPYRPQSRKRESTQYPQPIGSVADDSDQEQNSPDHCQEKAGVNSKTELLITRKNERRSTSRYSNGRGPQQDSPCALHGCHK
jgi:hypothetical protein